MESYTSINTLHFDVVKKFFFFSNSFFCVIELTRYVVSVTPIKILNVDNPVCDGNTLTEDGTHIIKFLLNNSSKRSIFAKKGKAKSPVKLTGLWSSRKGNEKKYFQNSNTVSKIEGTAVAFIYEQPFLNRIIDIFTQQPIGSFDVKGRIMSFENTRSELCLLNSNHSFQQ